MAFFREVGEDIRNMVDKDPAARNGLEVLLSGNMGAYLAQTGALAVQTSLPIPGESDIAANQIFYGN